MRRIAFLSVLLAACAPDGAEPSAAGPMPATRVLASLPVVGGCSDVFAYAATADDTKAFFVHVDGAYAADASQSGQPVDVTFVLPHPDVTITARWGTDLTINECNDVFLGQPVVDGEAAAVAGTLHMTLEPLGPYQPWDMSNDAVFELDGIVFEDDSGRRRVLTTTLETVVGWLPG